LKRRMKKPRSSTSIILGTYLGYHDEQPRKPFTQKTSGNEETLNSNMKSYEIITSNTDTCSTYLHMTIKIYKTLAVNGHYGLLQPSTPLEVNLYSPGQGFRHDAQ